MTSARYLALSLACFIFLLTTCRPGPAPSTETPTPATPPLPIGQPLKGSQLAVYRLMENGHLRHITEWSTYLSFGYQPENLITVSDEQLSGYPLGLPLTVWLTGPDDPNLYFVQDGVRYVVPNLNILAALDVDPLDISLVSTEFIEQFPLADDPFPNLPTGQRDAQITAAAWHDGFLWLADDSGRLARWNVDTHRQRAYQLPGIPVIRSLISTKSALYAGTERGGIWQLSSDGTPIQLVNGPSSWVSALVSDQNDKIWYADINHYSRTAGRYQMGRGLVQLEDGREVETLTLFDRQDVEHDPLRSITALAFNSQTQRLWAGTRFAGLVSYNLKTKMWQRQRMLNSPLAADIINDLKLAADGSLWLATVSGVSKYNQGRWENFELAQGVTNKGALSLAIASDDTVWVGGDQYIARLKPDPTGEIWTSIEQPYLADHFRFVVLDKAGHPWFFGRDQKIHFNGQTWWVYDDELQPVKELTFMQPPPGIEPPPVDFPDPTNNYITWLQSWPRPKGDNGRGMHFVQDLWVDEQEAKQQIDHLKQLDVRWALVNYANHYQLKRLAPLFAEAGIMVVWRPFARPYEDYPHWQADIEFLRSWGLPPYMQLYNEPSLAQEWDKAHPIDQDLFLQHLIPAIRQVYKAGGYVGLQFIDPDWLQQTLQSLKDEGLDNTFDRLFFVPHPYGLNHPPAYDEDINGVLGFQEFAKIFEAEIGFVPVMVAGEGGWRPGEAHDNRYPPVSDEMHRDYHLAVFEWFRTRRLSNGDPLPDYLFAFSPWLIADPHDPAAWFDSESGDRTLTIEAVEALPPFERKFTWDK